jgi:hypothetical protein
MSWNDCTPDRGILHQPYPILKYFTVAAFDWKICGQSREASVTVLDVLTEIETVNLRSVNPCQLTRLPTGKNDKR